MVACIDVMDPAQWLMFALLVGGIALFFGSGFAYVWLRKNERHL